MSGSSNGKTVRLSNGPVFEWHQNTGHDLSGFQMVNHFPFDNRTGFRNKSDLPFENRTNRVRLNGHSITGRFGNRMVTVFVILR